MGSEMCIRDRSKKYKEPVLAENKENVPCNNHFFCLAILLFNSNQENASNHNDPSGI